MRKVQYEAKKAFLKCLKPQYTTNKVLNVQAVNFSSKRKVSNIWQYEDLKLYFITRILSDNCNMLHIYK